MTLVMLLAMLLAVSSAINIRDLHQANIFLVTYGNVVLNTMECSFYDPEDHILQCNLTDSIPQILQITGKNIAAEMSSVAPTEPSFSQRNRATFMQSGMHRICIDNYTGGNFATAKNKSLSNLIFRTVGSQPDISNTTLQIEFVLGYDFY